MTLFKRPDSSKRTGTRSEGFTVVESLIALTLSTFAVLSIGALLAGAMMNSSVAADITEQTVSGSSQLEMLLALPWDDLQLRAGGDLGRSVAGYSTDPVVGAPDAFVRWLIEDEGTAFKRITVVAGVRRSTVGTREVRIETFRRRTESES
jgi:hypothetical protein